RTIRLRLTQSLPLSVHTLVSRLALSRLCCRPWLLRILCQRPACGTQQVGPCLDSVPERVREAEEDWREREREKERERSKNIEENAAEVRRIKKEEGWREERARRRGV